ncbi:hypothetical protein H6G89_26585 [Oscillatoria sp. FACHB-1407]|uniref:hypothetical protein n=1 Tax=Oscillatoria sp. FACHB-1407 TaxID=2692847 RepID=UPI0016850A34|nr:hypothetical protein [Oscillatoria sp. FACHB-1407]MBD2464579.1 hypothetical protein [Oscillatoria sp. FACHB-1407]
MAGLFGFFGKKKTDEGQATPQDNGKPQAYFLDADDAKTLGNIEYMRTAKMIKHTFPKTASSKSGFESVVQVSSMGMTSGELQAAIETAEAITQAMETNGAAINGFTSNGAAPKAESNGAAERRRSDSDSSMDMFRNMARDIRKR